MITNTMTPTTSAAADFTAGKVDLGDTTNYSFHFVFTGSDIAGTISIQTSNDGTNFVELSSTAVTSAADKMLSAAVSGYRFVRYDWDYDSGTGNITVTSCLKGRLGPSTNRTGK